MESLLTRVLSYSMQYLRSHCKPEFFATVRSAHFATALGSVSLLMGSLLTRVLQLQYDVDTMRLLLAVVHSLRSHCRHRSLRNCTWQRFTSDQSSYLQYAVDTSQLHVAVVYSLCDHCWQEFFATVRSAHFATAPGSVSLLMGSLLTKAFQLQNTADTLRLLLTFFHSLRSHCRPEFLATVRIAYFAARLGMIRSQVRGPSKKQIDDIHHCTTYCNMINWLGLKLN